MPTNSTSSQNLQTLKENEHLIEFSIFGYSLDPELIRTNIDFFETNFDLSFEDPVLQNVTASIARADWNHRLVSGTLTFDLRVVLSETLSKANNETVRCNIQFKAGSTLKIITPLTEINFQSKNSPEIVELYPRNFELSQQTREYLYQKPSSNAVNFSESTTPKVMMVSLVLLGIMGSVSNFCNLGFVNIGSSFIKLFMIIELIGKFLYLPVWFKGGLLETLYCIAQFSDLV